MRLNTAKLYRIRLEDQTLCSFRKDDNVLGGKQLQSVFHSYHANFETKHPKILPDRPTRIWVLIHWAICRPLLYVYFLRLHYVIALDENSYEHSMALSTSEPEWFHHLALGDLRMGKCQDAWMPLAKSDISRIEQSHPACWCKNERSLKLHCLCELFENRMKLSKRSHLICFAWSAKVRNYTKYAVAFKH